MSQFNWKDPDYLPIYVARHKRLNALRRDPALLALVKKHYRESPTGTADFINDWALTIDPRVKGRSPVMPFLLFPRQIELLDFIARKYAAGEPGIVVKSRDVGASWLAMAWGVTKCLFTSDFMVGVGSAKEDKIDRSGDPDTLFYKARMFLQWIPVEFRAGWELSKHSAHMRLVFPGTNSSLTGEAGDNIGRGGRKSVYFVDEAAHIERPMLIDASLAATTECRIDMSSVNTMANSFAEKAHAGNIERFNFGWRDDPRKDQAWYDKKKRDLDPVIVAQEIDCNFNASADNVVIASNLVEAAIGLAERLGINLRGPRKSSLDIADQGRDKCAWASRDGNVLDGLLSWSGANMDIAESVSKAVGLTEEKGGKDLIYDADGMGANVRGDVRVMKEIRQEKNPRSFATVRVMPFRGSGAVLWPEKNARRSEVKNKDMFQNYKAQAWWFLYTMFVESDKANRGEPYDPDLIISIDPALPELTQLKGELSQPQWKWMTTGKRVIDKQPDDTRSPNLADAVMMLYSPRKSAWNIADATIEAVSAN